MDQNEMSKVYITHKELKSYLDLAIELLHETGNTSVIKYAIKVISKSALKEHSQKYYFKRIHHLLLLYPYLVTLLDEFVFQKLAIKKTEIEKLSQSLFELKQPIAIEATLVFLAC
jgi:hypothetical protein